MRSKEIMTNFWNKTESPIIPVENTVDIVAPTHSDPKSNRPELEKLAMDSLGALLRIWGKHAFDLDGIDAKTIHHQCDQWARHILVVAPHPDSAEKILDQAELDANLQRDWQGLRKFATELRHREHTYVVRQFKDTRKMIGDFVQTLGKILAEDQEEQARVSIVLDHLRKTIETNTPLEVLSREAMQAINVISEIAEERNQRHRHMFEDMTARLQTLRGELNAARHEMELDSLTRLFNRKAFNEQLSRVFELSKLSGQSACLLMLDADHFKDVNDQFGHPVGDLVLKQLADCCLYTFPRKTDFVARYGGEEFVVVLQETPQKTALALAERLLQGIRALRIAHDQGVLSITVSIGVADIGEYASASAWLQAADDALYQAKRNGRNRVECRPA